MSEPNPKTVPEIQIDPPNNENTEAKANPPVRVRQSVLLAFDPLCGTPEPSPVKSAVKENISETDDEEAYLNANTSDVLIKFESSVSSVEIEDANTTVHSIIESILDNSIRSVKEEEDSDCVITDVHVLNAKNFNDDNRIQPSNLILKQDKNEESDSSVYFDVCSNIEQGLAILEDKENNSEFLEVDCFEEAETPSPPNESVKKYDTANLEVKRSLLFNDLGAISEHSETESLDQVQSDESIGPVNITVDITSSRPLDKSSVPEEISLPSENKNQGVETGNTEIESLDNEFSGESDGLLNKTIDTISSPSAGSVLPAVDKTPEVAEQRRTSTVSTMSEYIDEINALKQDIASLKLELNASQQEKTSLELQLRQKEEIIIKVQAEQLKNEHIYKQEVKHLKLELKENKLLDPDCCKKAQEALKEAKAREENAISQLNAYTRDEYNTQKIMEEYEKTISARISDFEKLKKEHDTATRHLANLEIAFSDIHQKYERSKTIIEGFKTNENTLRQNLQIQSDTITQHEERYESLKAHAKAQIEKSNKEIRQMKDSYETEINKLNAVIKRLEIKCSALQVTVEQKTNECAALSSLCEEVTGKKI